MDFALLYWTRRRCPKCGTPSLGRIEGLLLLGDGIILARFTCPEFDCRHVEAVQITLRPGRRLPS